MVSSLATLLFSVKKNCSEPIKWLRAESRYFLRSTGHSPLSDARVAKVVVGFDGETDSGQIDGISAFRDVFWFSVKMSEEFRRRKDSALRAGIFKA
jgi:hypothetical protein